MVIGALSVIKGADVVEAVAVEAKKRGAPVELHLVGYAYRSLKVRPASHLTVHGEYKESELGEMLAWLKPDLVWFPALWPETYSYTLSACLEAGLPVVAPNLGAFPGRLHGRPWTWLIEWDTPADEVLAFFEQILSAHFVPRVPPPLCVDACAGKDAAVVFDYASGYLPPCSDEGAAEGRCLLRSGCMLTGRTGLARAWMQ